MIRARPIRVSTVLCSVTAAMLLVAGCGDGGDEPAGLDAEQTTDAADPSADGGETPEADEPDSEPTDQPTPDETAGDPGTPAEHEFPDAGVTVVAPAAETPAEEAALATYVKFVEQWRLSLREVQLSQELEGVALQPVLDEVVSSLDYQETHDIRYSGAARFTPTIEKSADNVVVLGGCADLSELTIVEGGEERPIDGIDDHPIVPMQITVADNGSGWMINENVLNEGESC